MLVKVPTSEGPLFTTLSTPDFSSARASPFASAVSEIIVKAVHDPCTDLDRRLGLPCGTYDWWCAGCLFEVQVAVYARSCECVGGLASYAAHDWPVGRCCSS